MTKEKKEKKHTGPAEAVDVGQGRVTIWGRAGRGHAGCRAETVTVVGSLGRSLD
jgi:hypothetical protein